MWRIYKTYIFPGKFPTQTRLNTCAHKPGFSRNICAFFHVFVNNTPIRATKES